MDEDQRTPETDEEPRTWVPGESGSAQVHSPASDHATRPSAASVAGGDPLDEPDPEPAEDDQPLDDTRGYVVLEEIELGSLVSSLLTSALATPLTPEQERALRYEVYQVAGKVDARNTEHALRMVAKARYQADGETTLVPVSLRSWKPTPVTTHADTKVSVG